jgi:FolB domain-containing protein
MPLAHKFANDQIFIDSLRLKCVCGPDAFGRPKAQPVDLSIRLGTLIERAAATDRVDLSVDYSELSKQLTNLEAQGFGSPAELIDTVVDLAMEKEGVWNILVAVNLSKGARMAKNVKWQRNTFPAEGVTDEWKLSFEGIEVPIIIGIEENLHERTMKQIVSIDLTWKLRNSDSTEFSIHDFPGTVDSIIEVRPSAKHESYQPGNL